MDFRHQYYLSNEFNQKILKYLEKITLNQISKKETDTIFNLIYPALIHFINVKKLVNPDIISDFVVQIYENFYGFLIKANDFKKEKDNFIFYYYFIKFLYFEYKNFNRKKNTFKNIKKNDEYQYIDIVKNEENIISSGVKTNLSEIRLIIKKCLFNHFENEEKVMFLLYYYFLIEKEDYLLISAFLKIPILTIIDIVENQSNSDNNNNFSRTLDEKIIEKLFNVEINAFRVSISRIKKKMKNKCNYLLENYLFIDEGEL